MNGNNVSKSQIKLHPILPHHSRQKQQQHRPVTSWTPPLDTDAADDDTVVTSNVSTCASTASISSADSWTTVGSPSSAPIMGAQAINKPTSIGNKSNYYQALSFQDDDIAVDSGASDHFGDEATPGLGRRTTPMSITMASATGEHRHSIAKDTFDLPLDKDCLDYHVFQRGDIQRPLFSVGKACDAGYKVTFDDHKCVFTRDNMVHLTGYRDPSSGLYLLPKHEHTQQHPKTALNAYTEDTIPQLMRYLHACAGFPARDTWIKAISQGFYLSWPGLTPSRGLNRFLYSFDVLGPQKWVLLLLVLLALLVPLVLGVVLVLEYS